jgi:hypothetical protein
MARWTFLPVVLLVTTILAGCALPRQGSDAPPARHLGSQTELGKGTVSSYAEVNGRGEPAAIGVVFSPTALDGLPEGGSDRHHCVDRNKDGIVDHATECIPTFEHVIPLPDAVARRADIPFRWVLLNWNPVGHIPPGIYDVPHFDIHFFMEPIANVFALRSGLCGPEFVSCDQFEVAKRPVPTNYIHSDYRDVDAVVPAMGNHLIDLTGPEFNKQPFTRSWIFGVYGGRVIFYEEMVTRAFLLSKPQTCVPIKSPKAVAVSGFYPTVSCLRHNATAGEITVSMEAFTLRTASPPQAAMTP